MGTRKDDALLEVGEDGERSAGVPAVAEGLEGGVSIFAELDVGLFGFAEEAGVAEIGGGVEAGKRSSAEATAAVALPPDSGVP